MAVSKRRSVAALIDCLIETLSFVQMTAGTAPAFAKFWAAMHARNQSHIPQK
jgi:hypothetical protein